MQKRKLNLKRFLKKKKRIHKIYIYIKSTYKNIIITVIYRKKTKLKTLLQLSSKRFINKAKKRFFGYSLKILADKIKNKFKFVKNNIFVRIYFSGISKGLRLLKKLPKRKFKILTIINRTPLPFNGCRGKKLRRR
jgi:ribosomal protein S11